MRSRPYMHHAATCTIIVDICRGGCRAWVSYTVPDTLQGVEVLLKTRVKAVDKDKILLLDKKSKTISEMPYGLVRRIDSRRRRSALQQNRGRGPARRPPQNMFLSLRLSLHQACSCAGSPLGLYHTTHSLLTVLPRACRVRCGLSLWSEHPAPVPVAWGPTGGMGHGRGRATSHHKAGATARRLAIQLSCPHHLYA